MQIIRKTLVILLFMLLPLLSFADNDSAVAQRYYQNAQSLFSLGKYDQALPDLNLIIDKYSSTVYAGRASLLLGEYYFEVRKDADKAFEYLQKTIDVSREDDTVSKAYFLRGGVYGLEGLGYYDVNKSIADYLRIINIYPGSQYWKRALYNISLLFEKTGNIDRAIWFMEMYLYAVGSRDTLDPYGILARYYFKKIDLENALIALSKSLEFTESPDDLLRSEAYSMHLIRMLKYKSKKTNYLYYAYDLNLSGESKKVIACTGDIHGYYFLDSRAKNLTAYSRDLVYQRTIVSNLKNPVNVQFDPSGRIVVNDGRRIFADGEFLSLSKGSRELRDIQFVSFDKELNIYVLDGSSDSVTVFDKSGRFLTDMFRGYAVGDEVMAVDLFDRVFLVSNKFKTINVIKTNGEFVSTKQFDGKNYDIKQAVDIAVDFIGNLYVLDKNGSLWIYDYNIAPIANINLRLFNIDKPQRIGFMPDGSIAVIESNNNVHLLK